MLLGRIQLGVTAEHPSPSLPADLQVPGRGEIAPAVADAPPGAAGRVSSRTGATPTTPAAPVTVGLPRFCPPLGGRSPPPVAGVAGPALGRPLPPSAYRHRAWWSKRQGPAARQWMDAGLHVDGVDMVARRLRLTRLRPALCATGSDRRKCRVSGSLQGWSELASDGTPSSCVRPSTRRMDGLSADRALWHALHRSFARRQRPRRVQIRREQKGWGGRIRTSNLRLSAVAPRVGDRA